MPRSKFTSSKCFLIEQHYAGMAEEFDWDARRVHRLCAALRFTPHELAAYIRILPSHMDSYLARGSFPKTVALHLILIERAVFPNSKPPVFPPP